MATVEEIQTSVGELTSTIASVDSKLDEVRAFITALQSGTGPVVGATPEQLQQILDGINAAKASAAAVLVESDALDTPSAP